MNLLKPDITLWGEDIPYVAGMREKGDRVLKHLGWPTAKTEAWKYTHFDPQILDKLRINTAPHTCDHGHCNHSQNPFPCYRLEFCDGQFLADHSNIPNGIEVKPLIEALFDGEAKKYLNKTFDFTQYPFAALNTVYLEQGFMLIATKNVILDKPIYIRYHTYHANLLNNIHNIILCEAGAQISLIEHYHAQTDDLYLHNVVNEIRLSPSARLNHYIYEDESIHAYHIALNSVVLKNDATYKGFCIKKQSCFSRHESIIHLEQEGARAEFYGVYRSIASQISDITTNIYHLAPETFSDQLIKGVADGQAKGIFMGKIHIAPNAQRTEGHQTHRALLLSNEAEIDCKPELEIYADDVKCSHGATCGDLDADQIFYMQSRGLSEESARNLLIQAHLNEVFEKIEDTDIKSWLTNQFF